MDAIPGRETSHPAHDPIDPNHDQPDTAIEDSNDSDLEAWLIARDNELDEMAWAIADRFRDEVGQ